MIEKSRGIDCAFSDSAISPPPDCCTKTAASRHQLPSTTACRLPCKLVFSTESSFEQRVFAQMHQQGKEIPFNNPAHRQSLSPSGRFNGAFVTVNVDPLATLSPVGQSR